MEERYLTRKPLQRVQDPHYTPEQLQRLIARDEQFEREEKQRRMGSVNQLRAVARNHGFKLVRMTESEMLYA